MAAFFTERADHIEQLLKKRQNPKASKKSVMKVRKVICKGEMTTAQVLQKLKSLLGKMSVRSMHCAGNQGESSGIRFLSKTASSIRLSGGIKPTLMGADW